MGVLRVLSLVTSAVVVMLALHGCSNEEPEEPESTPTPAPPFDGNRPKDGCTCCTGNSVSPLCALNHCGNSDGAAQKWCYVEEGLCADQAFKSLQHWSYLACDKEQDPTYIAIEAGNCRGQGYEPILTESECTNAYIMAAEGFHHDFHVQREANPNKPEGCYFDEDERLGDPVNAITLDLYLNIDAGAAGRGVDQAQGLTYKQLCKSS